MLLSEVLQIAKKYQQLNEEFKSDLFTNVLNKLNNSSLTLIPKFIDNSKTRWRSPEPLDSWNIKYKYIDLSNSNQLTQELLDDPEQREKLFNITYVPKKFYKNSFQIDDRSVIDRLLYYINIKTGVHIGLSEITDKHFIEINPDEANKKFYKSSLQFWVGYDNELKAICQNNSIIAYIVKDSYWLKSNPDYKGPTNMNLFTRKSYYGEDTEQIQKEFIDKAFIKIPVYKLYYYDNDIKKLLGSTSIKKLKEKTFIYKVFVLNEEGTEKSNYNEIYKTRLEYKQFLKEQKELAELNRKRYKNIIELNKNYSLDDELLKTIDSAYDIIFNVYNSMLKFMMSYLDKQDQENYIFRYYEDITLTYDYFNLENIIKANVHDVNYGRSRSRTATNKQYNIYCIGDAFVIINYYLELLLNKLNNIISTLNNLKQYDKNNENDKDNIVYIIKSLKDQYKDFLNKLNYKNDYVLTETIKILNRKKINPEFILNDLFNIKKIQIK